MNFFACARRVQVRNLWSMAVRIQLFALGVVVIRSNKWEQNAITIRNSTHFRLLNVNWAAIGGALSCILLNHLLGEFSIFSQVFINARKVLPAKRVHQVKQTMWLWKMTWKHLDWLSQANKHCEEEHILNEIFKVGLSVVRIWNTFYSSLRSACLYIHIGSFTSKLDFPTWS